LILDNTKQQEAHREKLLCFPSLARK